MARPKYVPPTYGADAFNCPQDRCGAFAAQKWFGVTGRTSNGIRDFPEATFALCERCHECSIWVRQAMVYPEILSAEPAHEQMPAACLGEFEEARSIFHRSPRGACALLRLAVEKLMQHLQVPGKDLNAQIGSLVAQGLPREIQMALDSCRVVGNHAVHPGEISVNDSPDLALKLFKTVNFIVEDQIHRPALIKEVYDVVPNSAREAIAKRDQ